MAASYPGLPEEFMRTGLIALLMTLAMPRIRLACRCPIQAAGPEPWPGGCGLRPMMRRTGRRK
jgi:hypothetical protein